MMYRKKISIITINFNNADGLEQTIKSVINQTYKEFEYIIIDGGSTDNSVEKMNSYSDFITYSISEKDEGIYNAMNKGLKEANGEYLLFLNSGDSLINDTILQEVMEAGLNHDLVYGDLLFFNEEKEWEWVLPEKLTFSYFYKFSIAHPSTFIKSKLFQQFGSYDENLKIVSDWKFFLLVTTKYNCSYKHLDKIISKYNFSGLSSNPDSLSLIEQERYHVLKQEFPLFYKDYEELFQVKSEMKKISYFIKTRRIIKKLLNQK